MGLNSVSCDLDLAHYLEHETRAQDTDKLANLTCEEMFYVKKILDYQIKPNCSPFMIMVQARVKLWLRDSRPKPNLPWDKLAKYWQSDFFKILEGPP